MKKGAKHTEETKKRISESNQGIGRPTLYKSEYDEQVFKLCLLGATDKDIASFFNISESTLNEWKLQHDTFSEAIKGGKFKADAEVANSLYKRAVGFEYDAVKIFNNMGEEMVVPYKEYVVPDVTAQKKWLSARQRALWAERVETALTGGTDENGNDKPIAIKGEVNVTDLINAINASTKR